MSRDQFVRPTDLAKRLGVKVETVTAWIRKGDLPAVNVGSPERPRYRVAPDHFAEFLERRKVAPEVRRAAPVRRRRTNPGDVYYFDPITGKELHTKPVPHVQHGSD